MKRCSAILAGCVLAAAAYAGDRLNVKTGQWETTVTTKIDGNPIPKNVLDQLPPDRRAKIEQAMATRAASKAAPKTTTTCMTEEDLDKGVQTMDIGGDCKKTILAQTPTHQEVAIECSRNGVSTKGHMTVDALSNESIKGKMEMNVGDGKVIGDFSGKWIGATCPESVK
ncbi:MAG TPA: DUF3617 domain-containing protein [Steroidobacteraceae bacterium]|jgi:hypothetical protein|nr:DUF3617 domain-containing protein [Steroidobacteraceae bacterium]